ncbi:MAG: hypothetical protein ACJA0W_001777 [Candidatus Azotimanducaceae bacterium]|jgi:hypothetical protein
MTLERMTLKRVNLNLTARNLLLIPSIGFLTACGFFKTDVYRPDAPAVSQVIGKLGAPEAPSGSLRKTSVADLIERFERVKATSEAPQEYYLVAKRLAQLRLLSVEQQLAEGTEAVNFQVPIAALEELRQLESAEQNRSEIAYQLARMQALKGAPDHVLASLTELIELGGEDVSAPGTSTQEARLEARFRRAEIYFSRDDYASAEQDYAKVTATPGQYQLHARYMLSWVKFKRGDLDNSLSMAAEAFAQLAEMEQIDQRYDELRLDLLRVTVIALDYVDGPDTLATLMSQRAKPDWQTDIYQALGDWYLAKARFADSAQTWATFLIENPLHRDAPRIALQVIDTQREAGFVEDIPALEVSFIERYGKQSDFYHLHGDEVLKSYQADLKPMFERYTRRLHAKAQQSQTAADYIAAGDAYAVWLVNFSDDSDAQEKRFLYAEVLQDAGQLNVALTQYERVIEEDPTTDFAREAAYAVLLGHSKRVTASESVGEDQEQQGVEQRVEANLRFVALFPNDHRSPVSQLKAANILFKAQAYPRALEVARLAITMPQPKAALDMAQRIIGHSAFELSDYASAADVYRSLLADQFSQELSERLLVTVFKQGEQAEQAGDTSGAIVFYDSLVGIDPNADLSRDAQYDIASLYDQLGDRDAATRQLEHFRTQYRGIHTAEITHRLVALYESSGNFEAAAQELLAGHGTDEICRVARYRAAELFLTAGNMPLAIEHFRFYAHTYPAPAALQMEAMHHMDLLYQQTREPAKRHFWLRKKRDTFNTLAADDRTERAKYLASDSMFLLAADQLDAFKSVRLTQPLNRSLKEKQRSLQASLTAYRQLAEIGVLEFVSKANYSMASLYQTLAEDLLASERPKNLNALEQDQYQLLLEEQAYPFEEQAIALHQNNLRLGWQAEWTGAVNSSLLALQTLSPGRFRRQEQEVAYLDSAQ